MNLPCLRSKNREKRLLIMPKIQVFLKIVLERFASRVVIMNSFLNNSSGNPIEYN